MPTFTKEEPAFFISVSIFRVVSGEMALQSENKGEAPRSRMQSAASPAKSKAISGGRIESTTSASLMRFSREPTSSILDLSARPRVTSLRPSRNVMTR